MKTNTNIEHILSEINEGLREFSSSSLSDLKPISPDVTDLFFMFNFSVFNSTIQIWPYIHNKLISREEYKQFKEAEEYAYKAFRDSCVSKYHIKTFCSITEILSDANLLRESGDMSKAEFTEFFLQARAKLFRMYSNLKKAYIKKDQANRPVPKSSIQSLRARLATLQNEN